MAGWPYDRASCCLVKMGGYVPLVMWHLRTVIGTPNPLPPCDDPKVRPPLGVVVAVAEGACRSMDARLLRLNIPG